MKYYEDEEINLKVDMVLLIFIILFIYTIMMCTKQYIKDDFGLGILLICIFLCGSIEIFCIYAFLANIINGLKNRKKVKEIKEKGIKITGIVKNIQTSYNDNRKNYFFKRACFFRRMGSSNDSSRETYYFAEVEYNFNEKTNLITSPSLNFYTDEIIGTEVDVYIYKDKYYIDNYKMEKTLKEIQEKDFLSTIVMILVFCAFIIIGTLALIFS